MASFYTQVELNVVLDSDLSILRLLPLRHSDRKTTVTFLNPHSSCYFDFLFFILKSSLEFAGEGSG